MAGEVSEQELPGIGKRYDVAVEDGSICVVIHHSGRRDLYIFAPRADEPSATLTLTDDQARRLGAVLGGAYFKPAVVAEMEAVIGGLLIDWVTLREDSPASGRSIAELAIRQQTGMTVAAIVRDRETIVVPGPDVVLRALDRLVVLGRREDLSGFLRHVVG